MYISIIAGAWSCPLLYLLPEEGLSFKAETSQNKTGAGVSENFPPKKNNDNDNLTDIPLGKQLPRESLTPAKVFENNVSTLKLGPSSGNKEMTTVNGNLSTEM